MCRRTCKLKQKTDKLYYLNLFKHHAFLQYTKITKKNLTQKIRRQIITHKDFKDYDFFLELGANLKHSKLRSTKYLRELTIINLVKILGLSRKYQLQWIQYFKVTNSLVRQCSFATGKNLFIFNFGKSPRTLAWVLHKKVESISRSTQWTILSKISILCFMDIGQKKVPFF